MSFDGGVGGRLGGRLRVGLGAWRGPGTRVAISVIFLGALGLLWFVYVDEIITTDVNSPLACWSCSV
jgi:hypothetical protein